MNITHERAESIEDQLNFHFFQIMESVCAIHETSNTISCLSDRKTYIDPSRGGALRVDKEKFSHAVHKWLGSVRDIKRYVDELYEAAGMEVSWELDITKKRKK